MMAPQAVPPSSPQIPKGPRGSSLWGVRKMIADALRVWRQEQSDARRLPALEGPR
jgi:hypothetical protein